MKRRQGSRGLWRTSVMVPLALGLHGASHPGEAQRTSGAPEVLEALDAYRGHWRSEGKTDPQGRSFHFEYDETWFDSGRTIAKVVITRIGPDGTPGVVFEGFKGREPSGDEVYYHAASPSGRGARGRVVLEGESLVTVYRGWNPQGDVVRIRDVFTPVEHGSFTSRTFLKSSSDAEWRQIGEDHWTRVAPAG